jgi:hypothetical protein
MSHTSSRSIHRAAVFEDEDQLVLAAIERKEIRTLGPARFESGFLQQRVCKPSVPLIRD